MKDWPTPVANTSTEEDVAGRLLLFLARFAEQLSPFLRHCANSTNRLPQGAKEVMLALATHLESLTSTLKKHGHAALGYESGTRHEE